MEPLRATLERFHLTKPQQNENIPPNLNIIDNYPSLVNTSNNIEVIKPIGYELSLLTSIKPGQTKIDANFAEMQQTINADEHELVEEQDALAEKGTLTQRRQMPLRHSKESCLHKIQNRIIERSKSKKANKSELIPPLSTKQVISLYTNKKLVNFKPTNLETIYEDEDKHGNRKLKRSVQFCDGLNTNKSLIKQRRAKIKRMFGKRKITHCKISHDHFMERLNRSIQDNSVDTELKDSETKLSNIDDNDATEVDLIPLQSLMEIEDTLPSLDGQKKD